jgi:hypothetical protein
MNVDLDLVLVLDLVPNLVMVGRVSVDPCPDDLSFPSMNTPATMTTSGTRSRSSLRPDPR